MSSLSARKATKRSRACEISTCSNAIQHCFYHRSTFQRQYLMKVYGDRGLWKGCQSSGCVGRAISLIFPTMPFVYVVLTVGALRHEVDFAGWS